MQSNNYGYGSLPQIQYMEGDLMIEDEPNLKPEINNFLWMHLPDSTTLKDAEEIAVAIYEMFEKAREKHANR